MSSVNSGLCVFRVNSILSIFLMWLCVSGIAASMRWGGLGGGGNRENHGERRVKVETDALNPIP